MTDTSKKFRRLFLEDMSLLHAELDRIWAAAQTLPLAHTVKNELEQLHQRAAQVAINMKKNLSEYC